MVMMRTCINVLLKDGLKNKFKSESALQTSVQAERYWKSTQSFSHISQRSNQSWPYAQTEERRQNFNNSDVSQRNSFHIKSM